MAKSSAVFWMCVAVAAWLVAGSVSTADDKPEQPRSIRVGAGKSDITPPIGYPMSGYYYERGATGVLDPLHAKAVVFDDGSKRLAILACDLIGISTDLCQTVRQKVQQATGIPAQHVMVTATHCHTAPDYYRDFRQYVAGKQDDTASDYPQRLVSGMVTAVEKAAASLSDAALHVGSGTESTVAFNRRFVTTDGSIRTWANYQDPTVVRAAGPIDPAVDILLVKTAAANADAKPEDVLAALTVFALHLDTTGGSQFSADFPHHLERTLQGTFGSKFLSLFAAGTCGDINHVNPRSKERNRPHVIGSRLGNAFLAAATDLREVSPALGVKRRIVRVPMKSFTPEELAAAEALIAKDSAGEKVPFLDEVKAYNTCLLALLRDGVKVEGAGPAAGRRDRGTAPSLVGCGAELPVEVQVLQLGRETAVVGLPGEVFVELGLAIKRMSPYRQTLVIELANGNESGYVPTRLAYQGGGYEVINSVLREGAGEMLVDNSIELLRELKTELRAD